ncbi:MAG: hypothetical protein WAR79_00560, partial [Melioribacteraceae bacterium]
RMHYFGFSKFIYDLFCCKFNLSHIFSPFDPNILTGSLFGGHVILNIGFPETDSPYLSIEFLIIPQANLTKPGNFL